MAGRSNRRRDRLSDDRISRGKFRVENNSRPELARTSWAFAELISDRVAIIISNNNICCTTGPYQTANGYCIIQYYQARMLKCNDDIDTYYPFLFAI